MVLALQTNQTGRMDEVRYVEIKEIKPHQKTASLWTSPILIVLLQNNTKFLSKSQIYKRLS